MGKVVLSEQHQIDAGKNQVQLNFKQGLIGGVYYLNVQIDGEPEVITRKVIHISGGNYFGNDDDDDDDDDEEEE